ncbi:MAG TPA: hypothetical protein VLJ37_12215 [bacterium]|nr:hypothetical protein [bacterium]
MKRFLAAFVVAGFSAILLNVSGVGGCGGGGGSDLNPNFPDLSSDPVEPTTEIVGDNTDQVVTINATADNQGGLIGTFEGQDASHVFCVIIDPAAGDLAELEVCELDRVNADTDSINGLCPEADAVTRCASSNGDSVPDFCQVTGETDYAFILMNLSDQDAKVAYEVVDVTGLPGQSCADLGITEDSIQADN